MTAAAAATMALVVFGFVLFATAVTRDRTDADVRADGIVVLTGGELRIAEGARLLSRGKARRMLISGVNPRTSRQDVMRIAGLSETEFNCCIDLGYGALDTIGNATETRQWVEQRQFTSLIVVTSSYHMPRGLAELALEMPHVQLVPHAVVPPSLRHTGWWLHLTTTRVLIAEYVKYLPAAARLTAQRLMAPFEERSPGNGSATVSGRY